MRNDTVRSPSCNLLLGRPLRSTEVVTSLLDLTDTPSEPAVLLVSNTHTADSLVNTWRKRANSFPERFGIVAIGDIARSAAPESSSIELPQASITPVRDTDLTGIGLAIDDYLDRWSTEQNVVLWFDSLTPLLNAVDLELAFRFCHVTLGSIDRANTSVYAHLDPSAHDSQTVSTFRHLFDDAIDVSEFL